MATLKKGMLTPAPQWWKHLRDQKRTFWHAERRAAQRQAQQEADATFVCPTCFAVSYHPEDIRHSYCGRCHAFQETP